MKEEKNLRKIEKVVVNVGVGRMSQLPNFMDKILPAVTKELSSITGQKPETPGAKKAIATFKTRVGQVVGLKVTLRGKRASDFVARVAHIVLPRVKDFRGLPISNVDTEGNLNFGIKEQVVFPEINQELSHVNFGLQITVVPSHIKNREEAVAVFRALGLPLQKSKNT